MNERREDADAWAPPIPGHWRRDFRLAEWLPGPVSRSCETWLLPALDRGFSEASQDHYGSGTKPGFVVVNGWCFTIDPLPTRPLRMLVRDPLGMARIAAAMARMATRPEAVERWIAIPGLERYRTTDLPALRVEIAEAERRIQDATSSELVGIVDALANATGHLMLGMVQAMGYPAKVEYALARFFADHLAGSDCRALDLSVGHTEPAPTPPHAVVTLDWCEPTAGERGTTDAPDPAVRLRLVEARAKAEATCRAALAGDEAALARFDLMLTLLARWAPVREQLAAEFTLAWPAMRRAMLRIGESLVEAGVLESADDVFEMSRDEIGAAVGGRSGSLGSVVEERRSLRLARRAEPPPLTLGKPVRQWRQVDKITALMRSEPPPGSKVVVRGIGTSPGSVTGVARVVLSPDEFDEFEPGEILVAPATAPAWTPLFAIAAGVVTEAGGPFAHTSIVAREFGIPAVVTATDATSRIRTGDVVTLDAGSGTISGAVAM